MAQWWPWAMRVTITSRFTAPIILVVITTVKERRVVAISLLYSNVTFGDILSRHWIESATTMLVVAFTFALMARKRRWLAGWLATDCLFKNSGAATKSRVVSTTNSNSMRSIKTAHEGGRAPRSGQGEGGSGVP